MRARNEIIILINLWGPRGDVPKAPKVAKGFQIGLPEGFRGAKVELSATLQDSRGARGVPLQDSRGARGFYGGKGDSFFRILWGARGIPEPLHGLNVSFFVAYPQSAQ